VITRARREVSDFLATAVMPSTVRTYNTHFKTWTQFLKDEVDVEDPLMRDLPEEERVFLVSLMMLGRHQCIRPDLRRIRDCYDRPEVSRVVCDSYSQDVLPDQAA
jgi:hypothetical protein